MEVYYIIDTVYCLFDYFLLIIRECDHHPSGLSLGWGLVVGLCGFWAVDSYCCFASLVPAKSST